MRFLQRLTQVSFVLWTAGWLIAGFSNVQMTPSDIQTFATVWGIGAVFLVALLWLFNPGAYE